MVSKTDNMDHDPFSPTEGDPGPETPRGPMLDELNEEAFVGIQTVDGKPVDRSAPVDEEETPEEVPEEEEPFVVPSGDPEQPPVEKTAMEEELTVEEQLNFNLAEEENK